MKLYELIKDRLTGRAPKGTKRSNNWPKVRKAYLEKFPRCACCGSTRSLQVHHIYPFYLFPDLELVEDNLITLCNKGRYGMKSCHLAIGHNGNYKNFNPDAMIDAFALYDKFKGVNFTYFKNS